MCTRGLSGHLWRGNAVGSGNQEDFDTKSLEHLRNVFQHNGNPFLLISKTFQAALSYPDKKNKMKKEEEEEGEGGRGTGRRRRSSCLKCHYELRGFFSPKEFGTIFNVYWWGQGRWGEPYVLFENLLKNSACMAYPSHILLLFPILKSLLCLYLAFLEEQVYQVTSTCFA